MIEYQILRWLLALCCVLAALRIRQWGSLNPLGPLIWFLAANALEHAAPVEAWSPGWWRLCSLPLRVLALAAAAVSTSWMFRASARRLDPRPRLYLELFSLAISGCFALIGLHRIPVEPFHAMDAGRQWLYLAMAVSWSLAWCYLRFEENLEYPRRQKRLGTGWALWLWLQFLGATTGAGGLLWNFVPWKGGLYWWLGVSDISIGGQILTVLWMAL